MLEFAMALDAKTGIFTFDDGPEIRDLEGMYGRLRRELSGKPPEKLQGSDGEESLDTFPSVGALKAP